MQMHSLKHADGKTCNHELDNIDRIWSGPVRGIAQTRLFRRTFTIRCVKDLKQAGIALFADSLYHLWINGHYLGRGPSFFHPHRRPVQRYDIRPYLRTGRNVAAVLVHAHGIALHNYVPSGCPGLVARIDLSLTGNRTVTLPSDASWRVNSQTGWSADAPRRSWAIGHIEHFHADLHPFDWQSVGYDDGGWSMVSVLPAFGKQPGGIYLDDRLPRLTYCFQPAVRRLRACSVSGSNRPYTLDRQQPCHVIGKGLMEESWGRVTYARIGRLNARTGGFRMTRMRAAEGVAVVLDLGAEYTGSVQFRMRSDTGGTIDIGWAERMEGKRPEVLRKGNSYVDCFEARRGVNAWFPIAFSAGRYLLLIFRGFEGTVELTRLGMLASEPDLDWSGRFNCSDARLNAVWALCERTVRVGTQEGLMDCPTREQAPYVGDGNPVARWIGRLTGDYSYWKHLIRETFAVQSPDGMIKTTTFSGLPNVLLDYALLAVWWVDDYVQETGDIQTLRDVLPACRRLLRWYERHCDDRGLFSFDWEHRGTGGVVPASNHRHGPSTGWVRDPSSAAATLRNPLLNVFIDHPGLGWHNADEPGIDRRGVNSAMNALLAMTLHAMADMLATCGESGGHRYRQHAARLGLQCRIFWNRRKQVYSDGIRKGRPLRQVSQQTNVWNVMAGVGGLELRRGLMDRIVNSADATMARCGPYFGLYVLPMLAHVDLHATALDYLRSRWGNMLDHGATTTWETFAGDHLDSYCHPWSAAPVDYLPRHVAGIGALAADSRQVWIRPRLDLLTSCSTRVMTVQGPITLAWRRTPGGYRLSGLVPVGVRARIILPDGEPFERKGRWQMLVPLKSGRP
ncbi:MAG: hypothetical protein A2269_04500 [Lentisphaerae bacterium RIFOXYA12_FULL_60_10]|nr:MAG: hypothetical protein A2269_04500 [Lentisphaerae bacterium RIFOXYA12_FULL_60_10]